MFSNYMKILSQCCVAKSESILADGGGGDWNIQCRQVGFHPFFYEVGSWSEALKERLVTSIYACLERIMYL